MIRLFIKPRCPWCHKAQQWLDSHNIAYQTIDVIADPKAMDEMVKLSGQTYAPVLEAEGKILADFGPEQLPGFFKNVSTTDGHG